MIILCNDTVESLKARASNIVEGTAGAYTEAMFYEDFPQFKKTGTSSGFVPSAVMDAFISMANSTVAEERWGDTWRPATEQGQYVGERECRAGGGIGGTCGHRVQREPWGRVRFLRHICGHAGYAELGAIQSYNLRTAVRIAGASVRPRRGLCCLGRWTVGVIRFRIPCADAAHYDGSATRFSATRCRRNSRRRTTFF